MSYPSIDPVKRFNTKVDKENQGGCWIWTGAKKPSGYGNFYMRNRYYNAHRASWEIHIGPVPDGLFVLHRCDTPSCVNPKHLFIGTPLENMQDMHKKGRSTGPYLGGELSPCAKLNREKVANIKRRLLSGEPGREMAREFGVSEAAISSLKTGKTWKSVAPTPAEAAQFHRERAE